MDEFSKISQQRLTNQLISPHPPLPPGEIVRRMGMVQAQDYLGALWALGLRAPAAAEADVEKAIAAGKIIRTWPARGTLHFVAAEDLRWMLTLLTPRAVQGAAGRYRQLGLDDEAFARSRKRVTQVLRGGNRMARGALYQALEASHISTEGQRGIHILGRLAQEGLICFGPRQGKSHVFVLSEEWAPTAQDLPHDQALAELTRRYFTSHGPATVKDFTWWSGLTASDARAGIEMAGAALTQEDIDGISYWRSSTATNIKKPSPGAALLPAFDEYLVGYTDRRAVLDPRYKLSTNAGGGMLNPTIVVDGIVIGVWKRILKKDTAVITPRWFEPPDESQQEAFRQAAERYGAFLGLGVELEESQDADNQDE